MLFPRFSTWEFVATPFIWDAGAHWSIYVGIYVSDARVIEL